MNSYLFAGGLCVVASNDVVCTVVGVGRGVVVG